VISRVGAVFQPNRVGASTLAAMAVDEADLPRVADIVSGFAEVNHNYEREHRYNLWFVVVAADDAHLREVLAQIEQRCGYALLDLPLQDEFFIDLGFDLKWT
jgi:DNA-binding Lrp family transcriptional regulator